MKVKYFILDSIPAYGELTLIPSTTYPIDKLKFPSHEISFEVRLNEISNNAQCIFSLGGLPSKFLAVLAIQDRVGISYFGGSHWKELSGIPWTIPINQWIAIKIEQKVVSWNKWNNWIIEGTLNGVKYQTEELDDSFLTYDPNYLVTSCFNYQATALSIRNFKISKELKGKYH